MILVYVSTVLLLFFVWTFSRQRYHILSLLVCLEAVMLSVLVFFYSLSLLYSFSSHLFLMLLVFAACEAAFGLSLLISLLRLRGVDLINAMSSAGW
uniref:NADH-ubiquinone oxidoreductase chain 4L n=1 Tax=Platevindex mortoni TaxID=637517 RepID=D3YHQ1_9EUPU|nr:NADH dehydrogenase subunit 4L [Platevindex mortoni]ADD37171.1 NADH dehydrogenase subunit 4L [Platevindex mortoni]UZH97743.1 NADH dehydrogenase subunit 4L [Platevindex mortoni]